VFKLLCHCCHLNCFDSQIYCGFPNGFEIVFRHSLVCLDHVPHPGFDVKFQRHNRPFRFFQLFPDNILSLVRAGKLGEAFVRCFQLLVYQTANIFSYCIHWLLSFLERFFCISNDFYGMCTAVQFLLQISTNRYVEPFIYYINK